MSHTQTLFRVWLKRSSRFAARIVSVISNNSHLHRHGSCRTRNVHGLTAFLFPAAHSTPSLLYLLNRSILCNPQHGVQFGGLAEQNPMTGYEPNDNVEVSSTEVTTTLFPSRRASVGSTYNISATPVSSEVQKKAKLENAGISAVNMKERGKCRTIHSNRNYVSISSHILTSTETCGDVLTQAKVKSRSINLQESYQRERESIMPPKESGQLYQDSLKRNIIRDCFLKNERIIY